VRRSALIAGGQIVVAISAIAGYEWHKTSFAIREPVVAVIGFNNLSGDPQQDWLGTELSESLTTDLAQSKGVRTVPTDDVATVKTELSVQPSQSLEREDLSSVRTAGGQSGLLWLQYYIPRGTEPKRAPKQIGRNYVLIVGAAVLAFVYVVVLGRGITLHR
jgi:hypothetical protein